MTLPTRKLGAIGLSEMSTETLRRAHAVHPVAAMLAQTDTKLLPDEPLAA